MRRFSLILAFSMIFSLLYIAVSERSHAMTPELTSIPLVVNGSFEMTQTSTGWANSIGPANWDIWIPKGTPTLSSDTAVYYEGKRSIKIAAPAQSRVDVNQKVPVAAGKTYSFSIEVETDNLTTTTSYGGAYVRTSFMDPTGKNLGSGPSTPKLLGTNDWTHQQFQVTMPANTSQFFIEIFMEEGKGTVWFDLVGMEEISLGSISLPRMLTIGKGETKEMQPVLTPPDTDVTTISWSSSDPAVATVDASGRITGQSNGQTVIKAALGSGAAAETMLNVDSVSNMTEYAQMRTKWSNRLTGNEGYDANDPDIAAAARSLADKVSNSDHSGFWDTMTKTDSRTALWVDQASACSPSTSYSRLKTMALAFTTQGSDLYQNPVLKADITAALDWLYLHQYNENTVYNTGCGWDWEIGIVQTLNDIVILMYDHLSATQIDNYMKPVDKFDGDPTIFNLAYPSEATGANRTDKAIGVTIRGMIGDYGMKIAQGRDALSKVFPYVKSGDGFYEDGSFVQHSNIAYTGSYGGVLLTGMANMLYLLGDTPWAVTDPNVNNVYHWITDSYEPLVYHGAMMDMTFGRAISRERSLPYRGPANLILLISQTAPPEYKDRFRAMVKNWYATDPTWNISQVTNTFDLTLVKSLLRDTSTEPRGSLTENFMFAGMDRAVHLRPDYALGLSMFSDRISAFEYGNGENKKGWYTGIGMLSLYNNDYTQYIDHYWPTVDMMRLPGTTTDGTTGTLKDWGSYLNNKTWVGGVSDELYGVAGMYFSLSGVTGSNLEGKKSWFMFDNEIVALGAGITKKTAGSHPVETIIENRKLNSNGNNALTVDGMVEPDQLGWSGQLDHVHWAHLQGNLPNSDTGYYFPETASIQGLRETRTGTWKEINDGGSTSSITRNYLSLAFEHGVQPNNASYSYVLLPNQTVAETMAYSGNPQVEVLSNTADIQAVQQKDLGITAANFWNPGTEGTLSSLNPASVLVREAAGKVSLSISDPTRKQSKITIELHETGLSLISNDDTVEVTQTGDKATIQVNVGGSLGKTHVVTFRKNS